MNESSASCDVSIKTPSCESLPVVPQEREQWVKRFLESGLSIRKFSAAHDLPRMKLWRWLKRAQPMRVEAGDLSNVQFAEVKLPAVPAGSDWVAELSLADGTVLRLSKEVPAAMLEQLLRAC